MSSRWQSESVLACRAAAGGSWSQSWLMSPVSGLGGSQARETSACARPRRSSLALQRYSKDTATYNMSRRSLGAAAFTAKTPKLGLDIAAGTCAVHVGGAATVRDGSQSAASAGQGRHGEYRMIRWHHTAMAHTDWIVRMVASALAVSAIALAGSGRTTS